MSWPRGVLFRHTNSRDVAFEVIKQFYVKEKRLWKLKVGWWNVGACHKPWPMCVFQNIQIPLVDCPNWRPMGQHERIPPPKHQHL